MGLMRAACLCALAASIAAVSPLRAVAVATSRVSHGCIERFDAATDYFPDKVAIEDAATFTVEYRRSFKVVTVKEAYPGGPAERYVLVQCGAPPPMLSGDLATADLPFRSVGVRLSPTSLAAADPDRTMC